MDNTLRLPVGYEIAPPDHIVGKNDFCGGPKGFNWFVFDRKIGKKVSEPPFSEDIFIRPIQQPKQEEQPIPTPPEGYTVISDPDYVYKKGDYFWSCDWIPCEASVGMTIRELHEEDSGDIECEIFPYAATDLREEETVLARKVIDHLTERYINSEERENKMSEEKKTAVMREGLDFQLSYLNEPGFQLNIHKNRKDPQKYVFKFDELKAGGIYEDLTKEEIIDLFDELIDGLSQMRFRVLKDIK